MAKTYVVAIEHQEENDDQLSVTGTVDGYQAAVVLSKRQLARMKAKARQRHIERELVRAYLGRSKALVAAGGHEVTLD